MCLCSFCVGAVRICKRFNIMGFCDKVIGFAEAVTNKDSVLKCLAAEFLGVFLIVLIGCGSCVTGWEDSTAPTLTQISLAFGLTIATVVHCIGHVSGGHVNPAVTVSMLAVLEITFIRSVLYIGAQLCGAMVGAAVLRALTPDELQSSFGQVSVDGMLSTTQGFFVEFTLTFCLIMTICAVTDKTRDSSGISPPFAIGMAVTAIHLFGIKYTGASVNPARAFGPCVVTGNWEKHWIYWLGPCLGGPLASVLYYKLFKGPFVYSRSTMDLTEFEDTTSTLDTVIDHPPLRSIIRKPRPRSDEYKLRDELDISPNDTVTKP